MSGVSTVEPYRHPIAEVVSIRYLVALVVTFFATFVIAVSPQLRADTTQPKPELLRRPPRASAIVQPFAFAGASKKARPNRSSIAACRRPGPTNHIANCKSDGLPAVEPGIATDGRLIVAVAADYNSYNGRPQLGFYWSENGRRWYDGGPLDIFPHSDANAGGDPLVAMDAGGVVYYAGMFFSYTRCNVGGIELLRRDPRTGRWSRTEIASNGETVLQDRPGFAVEGNTVFYAWARFDSCEGTTVKSQLRVALLPAGPGSRPPGRILDVPGSTFSQGAVPAGDGRGGFWLAWEEYPDATANDGSIKLAHWSPRGGWDEPRTISSPGFRDLPEPLPGFRVDTSSVPTIAVSRGVPHVVWASADTGRGRIYLWTPKGLDAVHDVGGDQLLPAVAADLRGGVVVSFSQANRASRRINRLLWRAGNVTTISSAPSYPRDDTFFSGRFIGWNSGLTLFHGDPIAVWPDLRRSGRRDGAISVMSAATR